MTTPSFGSTPRSQPSPDRSPAQNPAPPALIISQRHLSLFEQCPRHYQAEILDRRSLPISDDQRHALQRGQQFHHLLQQRALGITSQLHDPQLDRWLDRLHNSATLQPHDDPSQYYLAEHTRTLALPPFTLLVRYDALIADRDRADIIDWKTYARPRQPQKLAHHWQTRLYRYVLAATSDYPPERIAMVYWFAEPTAGAMGKGDRDDDTGDLGHQGTSDRVTLPYSIDQFKRDHHDIAGLLDRLATNLTQDQSFPTRLDLGQPCNPDRCACVQLQLFGDRESDPAAIELGDINEIPEVVP
jgi:hypothetical protein